VSVVRIPPVLRTSTGGEKQVEVGGTTVREVIDGLVTAYPGLAPQLLDGGGDLNRFVNVFLNDTDVRHLQALDTPVDPRDTLLLLPAMAGGAGSDAGAGHLRVAAPPRHGTHGGPCFCPERVVPR
jgi:molybdopterin converting factor small subunit